MTGTILPRVGIANSSKEKHEILIKKIIQGMRG